MDGNAIEQWLQRAESDYNLYFMNESELIVILILYIGNLW